MTGSRPIRAIGLAIRAVSLAILLVTIPLGIYVPVWAATTIMLIVAGIGVSVLWMRSVLRRFGIGFRFGPDATM